MRFSNNMVVVANVIPAEVNIYLYTWSVVPKLAAFGLMFCVPAFLFASQYPHIEAFLIVMFLIMGLISLFNIYTLCKEMLSDGPQIRISNKGIQTAKSAFCEWDMVSNESVFKAPGRGERYYLEFSHPHGKVHIRLNNLNISAEKMEILLHFFRQRYQNPHFKY